MKIYLASSWRNATQPVVLRALRASGHYVYDFTDKTPPPADSITPHTFAFGWREVDPNWMNWTPEQYLKGLQHEYAEAGFKGDFNAMKWADACVLLLPCNRSAHLESGWFIGQGRPCFILLDPKGFEPELMYKMATGVFKNLEELLRGLDRYVNRVEPAPCRIQA